MEKNLKLPEMQFHENFFLFTWFHEFFLPGMFYWPAVKLHFFDISKLNNDFSMLYLLAKTVGMIYGLQNLGPIITDLRHQTRLHMAHWSHFDWMCFFAVSDLKKELLHTLQFEKKNQLPTYLKKLAVWNRIFHNINNKLLSTI